MPSPERRRAVPCAPCADALRRDTRDRGDRRRLRPRGCGLIGHARPLPWVARRTSPGLPDVAPLFTSRETALHLRPERLTGFAFGGGGRTSRRRHRRGRRWRGGRRWRRRRLYGRLIRDVG